MKQLFTLSTFCLLPQLLYSFGTQAPAQAVDAQITCSDGTVQMLTGVTLNATTDLMVYVKPEKAKSKTNNEIFLEFNPHDNAATKSLLTLKTISFKNKSITYIYQDEKNAKNGNSTKHKFHEVEIDGTPFLISDNNKLHGKDKDKSPRTIDLNIVEKIMVTDVYKKSDDCKVPA
jgi:hypothetical protein